MRLSSLTPSPLGVHTAGTICIADKIPPPAALEKKTRLVLVPTLELASPAATGWGKRPPESIRWLTKSVA